MGGAVRRGTARRAMASGIAAAGVAISGCSAGDAHPSGARSPAPEAAIDGSPVKEAGSSRWDAATSAPPPPCSVVAPTACPDPPPHYADVAPILQERCVGCHSGADGGPWALTDYDHVASWADAIQADLLDCSMPPLDAGVAMTADETSAILTW